MEKFSVFRERESNFAKPFTRAPSVPEISEQWNWRLESRQNRQARKPALHGPAVAPMPAHTSTWQGARGVVGCGKCGFPGQRIRPQTCAKTWKSRSTKCSCHEPAASTPKCGTTPGTGVRAPQGIGKTRPCQAHGILDFVGGHKFACLGVRFRTADHSLIAWVR